MRKLPLSPDAPWPAWGGVPGRPRRPGKGRRTSARREPGGSELECFVLGLVWRHGPSSPYTIRRQLHESPSSQWSGSAGAIYPLMQRLEKRGLLRSKAGGTGQRRSREYTITTRGERALRAWIGPPLPPEAVTVSHDPLRSRVRFLDVLPPAERRAWLDAAIESLEEVLERVRAWRDSHEPGEPLGAILSRSGELDVEARMRWLGEAKGLSGVVRVKSDNRKG